MKWRDNLVKFLVESVTLDEGSSDFRQEVKEQNKNKRKKRMERKQLCLSLEHHNLNWVSFITSVKCDIYEGYSHPDDIDDDYQQSYALL